MGTPSTEKRTGLIPGLYFRPSRDSWENELVRIALAQVNPTVGDLAGNAGLVIDGIERARDASVDIVCFPELVITGYPPEDLVLKPSFVRDNLTQLDVIARATQGISAVVGFVDQAGDIFNAAAFLHDGEVKAIYHKVFLPNYGVFDAHGKPLSHAESMVPDFLIADIDTEAPVHASLEDLRHEAEGARRLDLAVSEVTLTSDPKRRAKPPIQNRLAQPLEGAAEIYAAVVLGTHDYMGKQGFEKVVIGMSGGVDSALTAAIACDALGPQNVIGVRMASRHTSAESLEDAELVAENLGMQLMDFSIEPPHRGFEEILVGYIEDDLGPEELVAAGHKSETVARVIQLVDRSEYKRRQAPPGVKITPRAFGRDRRMPIVNRYSPNGARTAPPRPVRPA